MSDVLQELENRKVACSTYVDQTKLLVTLASGFVLAPAALLGLSGPALGPVGIFAILSFVFAELFFIGSILLGYLAIASVVGSQDDGTFNVYRPATRVFSLLQIGSYLSGMAVFLLLVLVKLLSAG
jgi:hypothetical protein